MPVSNDLETAKEIGKLTGMVSALSQRMDNMHSDNQTRHSETVSLVADIQAQLHEIKHTQNNDAMKVISLAERNKSEHERNNEATRNLVQTIIDVKQEVLINRNTAAEKLDALFSLRNKFAGGAFIVFLMLSLYGREVSEFVLHMFVGPKH